MKRETIAIPCIANAIREDSKTRINRVTVPGSKSITNRALLLATLAQGETSLSGVLFSDDSRHFLQCVQDLGFDVQIDEENRYVTVNGLGGTIPREEASINVGSAGTAARFLAAALGVSKGTYYLDASEQMCKRPMGPLLTALSDLGCQIYLGEKHTSEENAGHLPAAREKLQEGRFPFTITSRGFGKDEITINIDKSSQFLSALLIASVLSPKDFLIHVEGHHGMAYIEMTCRMIEQFGASIDKIRDRSAAANKDALAERTAFLTKAGQSLVGRNYSVEPDASAAAYFYAMCPLLGIPVQVSGVHFDSLQGDVQFIRILEKMGCTAKEDEQGVLLLPPEDGIFHGLEVDMSACSDQAITLAALAPFADAPTTITGIGHIRLQESDRLSAIAMELGKMGIRCEEGADFITIYPGMPMPCNVNTYEDHRMAMGFSLVGLRAEGIVIEDPDCCKKTFENYFEVLEDVIQSIC